jgi:capsular polysaccharide biosynthesis protein
MNHGPADARGAVGQHDPHDEDMTLTMPRIPADGPEVAPEIDDEEAPEFIWADDDLGATRQPRTSRFAASLAIGLAAVPYLGAAMRRRGRLICVLGIVGLVLGVGYYSYKPPPFKASTSVIVAQNPDLNPLDAVLTDVAMMQSRSLAELAMHKLGLKESVTKFQATYSVDSLTDRVLAITVSAKTSAGAVQEARALATDYLQFRAEKEKDARLATIASLNQQVSQAKQQLDVLDGEITYLQRRPATPARAATIGRLRGQQTAESTGVTQLQMAVTNYSISSELTDASMIASSGVLDGAAPLPTSKLHKEYVYVVGGLVGGLALGAMYVLLAALMTDRLRRRDDVARALGAPVRLSVGRVHRASWRPGRRGLAATRAPEVQRVAAQLRTALPEHVGGGAAALAVIAVDDPRLAALPVVAMAISRARAGWQVVLADLSDGAVAARLLGVSEPGVRIVTADGEQLALVVPESEELTPEGPLRHVADSADEDARVLPVAPDSGDVLLTLVSLDPGVGADHLVSWATDAVAIVTAGESSATRVHAAGEMMRQAGVPISAAFLLCADKNDESVGILSPATGQQAGESVSMLTVSADGALERNSSVDRNA